MTQSALNTATLLLVDDDDAFRQRLARAMGKRCSQVLDAGCADKALEGARQSLPTHALVDMRMPGPSGLELIEKLLELNPDMRVVMLTGYGSIATAVEAIKRGAHDYLTKPAGLDAIENALFGDGKESSSDPDVPTLSRVEWEHIQRVLKDCEGNVSEAARRLGIHRRSLQRKMNARPYPAE